MTAYGTGRWAHIKVKLLHFTCRSVSLAVEVFAIVVSLVILVLLLLCVAVAYLAHRLILFRNSLLSFSGSAIPLLSSTPMSTPSRSMSTSSRSPITGPAHSFSTPPQPSRGASSASTLPGSQYSVSRDNTSQVISFSHETTVWRFCI